MHGPASPSPRVPLVSSCFDGSGEIARVGLWPRVSVRRVP